MEASQHTNSTRFLSATSPGAVEIDALAAVMLGITAEEPCAIYRSSASLPSREWHRNGEDARVCRSGATLTRLRWVAIASAAAVA